MFIWPAMPTIGRDNGVSMGVYDYGVATLKYCYISAGSKGWLNSYLSNFCVFISLTCFYHFFTASLVFSCASKLGPPFSPPHVALHLLPSYGHLVLLLSLLFLSCCIPSVSIFTALMSPLAASAWNFFSNYSTIAFRVFFSSSSLLCTAARTSLQIYPSSNSTFQLCMF